MRNRLVCTVAALVAAGAGVAAFARGLEGIPLVWKPTSQVGESGAVDLTGLGQIKVKVEPLTDSRENAHLIGENREDRRPKPVTTNENVPVWCSSRFRMLLGQFGLDTVDGEADVTIRGDLKSFFVVETNTYEGDVRLKIEVLGKDGKVLWSGMTAGTTNRFGRSYKAENYHEVLSDSFLDAVQNLFKNDGFRESLKHR